MSPHRETVREELGALGGSYNSGQYIARQLDKPIDAVRSAAANSTHQARFARLERLEMSLQDTEQLIAISRVGFDGDRPQRSAVSGPTVSLFGSWAARCCAARAASSSTLAVAIQSLTSDGQVVRFEDR